MLFAEALETQKCLDEGVLTTTADANIGSIFGIGFPPWTGGSAQYIVGYPGGEAGFRRPRRGAGRQVRRPLHAAGLAALSCLSASGHLRHTNGDNTVSQVGPLGVSRRDPWPM